VIFQTRQGYLTKPGPATSWTASGGKRRRGHQHSHRPIERRRAHSLFHWSRGRQLFHTSEQAPHSSPQHDRQQQPSTSASSISPTLAFSPHQTSTISCRPIELGCFAGVIDYAQRLFWFGERNKLNNFVNLGFDGGFTGPPCRTIRSAGAPIQSSRPAAPAEQNFVVWGAAYSIVGNGSTATRGMMTQSAVQDSLGAPLIQANTD